MIKKNNGKQALAILAALALSTQAALAAPETNKTIEAKTAASDAPSTPAALPPITAAPGSPEEVAQLRSLVEALTSRLQTLEVVQQKTTASVDKANVRAKFPLTISGLLQVQGIANLSGGGSQLNDTFRLRRGELKLTDDISDRISAQALFDIAKTKIDSSNRSDAILQEITLSYLLSKGKNNNTYADVGQFKLPLGYESLVSSGALPFLERSMIFAQGKYGDVRDTGAQLRGTAGKLEYRLGVFNSLGDRQNNIAVRDSKAVAGRLLWKASNGVQLGGSAAGGSDSGHIFNVFANYTKNKWWVWGEYAKGSSGSGVTIVDGNGYNLSAGYHLSPKLEAVARYDKFNDSLQGDATEDILGLNYYLKSNNAKIQLDLVKHDGPFGSGSGFQHDWAELRSGFQVAF